MKTMPSPRLIPAMGFTLTELLFALAITMIISLWAVPGFHSLILSARQDAQYKQLHQLITLAREMSLSAADSIVLCAVDADGGCTDEWFDPRILVFTDNNRNHFFDDEDVLIREENLKPSQWKWSASGNRNMLRFRNDGSPKEFGRFTLCPATQDQSEVLQLVMNRMGRMYRTEIPVEDLDDQHFCRI